MAPPKRILRSPDEGPKTVHEVAMVLGIPDLAACIMRFVKSNGSTKLSDFPESIAALQKAQAQRFKMLQIPVPVFQDPDLYINHNLRCTGSESFRGACTRNDPARASVGDYLTTPGELGGRRPC